MYRLSIFVILSTFPFCRFPSFCPSVILTWSKNLSLLSHRCWLRHWQCLQVWHLSLRRPKWLRLSQVLSLRKWLRPKLRHLPDRRRSIRRFRIWQLRTWWARAGSGCTAQRSLRHFAAGIRIPPPVCRRHTIWHLWIWHLRKCLAGRMRHLSHWFSLRRLRHKSCLAHVSQRRLSHRQDR